MPRPPPASSWGTINIHAPEGAGISRFPIVPQARAWLRERDRQETAGCSGHSTLALMDRGADSWQRARPSAEANALSSLAAAAAAAASGSVRRSSAASYEHRRAATQPRRARGLEAFPACTAMRITRLQPRYLGQLAAASPRNTTSSRDLGTLPSLHGIWLLRKRKEGWLGG